MRLPTWKREQDHYRASLAVDFPPSAGFVYRAWGNMGARDPMPCLLAISAAAGEIASDDVIVIGDSASRRYLLAGALTAFRSQTFFRVIRRGGRFTRIEADQPDIRNGETPEEILVLEGNDWRELLFQYAETAAKRMNAPSFDTSKNMTGYCTWYYYYKNVCGQDLLDNLDALAANRNAFSAEYVQIDDGYQKRHGDWLEQCGSWHFSMKEAAERIQAKGMKPGIWIMPFVASTASRIFQEHPGWFVRDENGEAVRRRGWTPPPEQEWCCLDGTHPEVQKYMIHVFSSMREMGYEYFKLDGLGYGMTDGVRYDRTATAVSAFRELLRIIRETVPDSLLMACSEPFMPCLGFFDNARVSCDTSRSFSLEGNPNRNFPLLGANILNAAHQTLSNFWKYDCWFRCDPDILMARQDNAFYTLGEAKFSVLTGILSGVSFTSDRLDTIAPDRLRLLGLAQKYRMRRPRPFRCVPCQWPIFYEGTMEGKRAVAVFNDSAKELSCNFRELELPENCIEILTGKAVRRVMSLPAHDAALFTEGDE